MELLAAFAGAFVVTLLATPIHMRVFSSRGIVGVDRHKPSHPKIPEMGGIAVFAGIVAGLLVTGGTLQPHVRIVAILALAIVFAVGLADDVLRLRQRTKLALLFAAGLPLLLLEDLSLSLLGFVLSPAPLMWGAVLVGMAAAANLTNILEGFNGEAAGLGVISTGSLILCGHVLDNATLMACMIPVCGALLAFLIFNAYPAKVFPGDTGTLLVGGSIAAAVILSDTVILGIIVLLPQIGEFFLKSHVRFGGVSYGPTTVDGAGILTPPPYASVANMLTRTFRLTEPRLVVLIWCIGLLCGLASVSVALVLG